MLRRTLRALGGIDPRTVYPYGLPKHTTPLQEDYKFIYEAPITLYPYVGKYSLNIPVLPPLIFFFWRSTLVVFVLTVVYDLCYGLPMLDGKEAEAGKPHHFFFGNHGGIPHHFWEYQDGWHVPNMSGARRYVD